MGLPFSLFTRRSGKNAAVGLLAAAAACLAAVQPVRAQQPLVSAVYTQAGGFFNYNFTVRNPTAFTLADVSISLPTNATATNLAAPTGFQIIFDASGNGPNMGIVDFATTTGAQDFFAGSTVSGFLLRSNAQLNGATFNALNVQGTSFTGTVTATAAPEPGALSLLLASGPAAAALLTIRRRRRLCASVSLKG